MKIKITVENVGINHARVEFEETCEPGGLKRLLDEVGRELTNISEKKPETPRTPCTDKHVRADQFTPASEGALKALWGAAMANRTDVESVCREYGVDPKNISKRDCWRMTHDLNEHSGYRQN